MKVCNKCNIEKENSNFSFKNKKLNRRSSTCAVCSKEYGKKHYLENKSKYVERARKFNKYQITRNRQLLFDYLKSKSCKDCGNADVRVLEFDHTNPLDKRDNVSNMLFRNSWKVILKEIGKCDIRCANCHRIKTVTEFNYFKNK